MLKKNEISAQYIGRDGSMGFEKDRVYRVRIKARARKYFGFKAYIWVEDTQSPLACPYDNLNQVLNNWKMVGHY